MVESDQQEQAGRPPDFIIIGATKAGWSALQKRCPFSDDDRLKLIGSMLQSYMEARALIPQCQLCEIRYSDVVQGQEECLRKIHTRLDLGNPPTQHIKATQGTYKKIHTRNFHLSWNQKSARFMNSSRVWAFSMEIYKAEHELHSTQGPAAALLILEKLGRVESMVEAHLVATHEPLGNIPPNQSHSLAGCARPFDQRQAHQ